MLLKPTEYPVFYQTYIDVLPAEGTIVELLESSLESFEELLYGLSENKHDYRYATNKWTISDVVQHLIDAERVFVYRVLRFSRGDTTDLSGFDENDYADRYQEITTDFRSLCDEFCLLRRSTIAMFSNLNAMHLDRVGTVDSKSISVRALGYISSGHVLHHLRVIEERYL